MEDEDKAPVDVAGRADDWGGLIWVGDKAGTMICGWCMVLCGVVTGDWGGDMPQSARRHLKGELVARLKRDTQGRTHCSEQYSTELLGTKICCSQVGLLLHVS